MAIVNEFPEINACGFDREFKGQIFKFAFDKEFTDIVDLFANVDCSSGSPTMRATHDLYNLCSDVIKASDITPKTKFLLKNLIWESESFLNNGPIPANHVVVPINYQQTDMRRENLQLLEGEPKNFKARDMPIVPDDLKDLLPFRFFPKVITLVRETRSAKNPLKLSVIFANKEIKKFICNFETVREVLDTKILPVLREQNPNWDAENDLYQRLIGEWCDYVV